jgi:multidrug efflux pump subunit AcrB
MFGFPEQPDVVALTISTGFRRDDAIVMIETFRVIWRRESPLQAASRIRAIGFTILG